MISYISGSVVRSESNAVVIKTGGIGYLVNVIPEVSLALKSGDEIALHTEQIVREESHALYGFRTVEELQLFQALLKVSGVGPKSSMAILGSLGVSLTQQAVALDDDEAFRRVPGIGPKTAKLICVQLAGKVGDANAGGQTQKELLDALTGLGYSSKVALDAISSTKASELSLSEGLRVVLASLSRKTQQ